MMDTTPMVYVAVDPSQPDAAWALCVDKPENARHTAKDLARWARKGSVVMRVDVETAIVMTRKWIRAEDGRKAVDAAQETLL